MLANIALIKLIKWIILFLLPTSHNCYSLCNDRLFFPFSPSQKTKGAQPEPPSPRPPSQPAQHPPQEDKLGQASARQALCYHGTVRTLYSEALTLLSLSLSLSPLSHVEFFPRLYLDASGCRPKSLSASPVLLVPRFISFHDTFFPRLHSG